MRSSKLKKSKAIQLRKQGMSVRQIESKLGISKSTLHYWFKNIQLSPAKKQKLRESWLNGLEKARREASKSHQKARIHRESLIEKEADTLLRGKDLLSKDVIKLAISILYLGEGRKSGGFASLGSSDPEILRFYIKGLRLVFSLPVEKIKCELHLRYDHDKDAMITFWSKKLSIPKSHFTSVSIDRRTQGTATYDWYKGVCVVNGGGVHVQKSLLSLSKKYSKLIIDI